MDEEQRSTPLVYHAEDEYRPEPAPEPMPPFWTDGSYRIGIHTSIAGDLTAALESASKLGCNALQIFSSSPRMWPRLGGSRIAEADAARFRARREELRLGPLAVHDNYLINLGSPEPVMRVRSIQAFRDELVRAAVLGADYLVSHPGSGLGSGLGEAIKAVTEGLRQAAKGMKLGGLRILIENTSGMGSALGWRFEEIAAIVAGCPELKLGVCVDTAHTFEAGYDMRSEAGLEQTLGLIDRTVGLERVCVVHVNDSKTKMGSRVDLHEHIGKGKIGMEAFRRILTHPSLGPRGPMGLAGRAFILETPIDKPGDDRRNVKTLWKLVGVEAKQAPTAEDGFSMMRKEKIGHRGTETGRKKKGKAGTTRKRHG